MSLKTHSLGFRLGNKSLIEDISLTFSPGHLYGILGPNGSGKSTLLKCLRGIWKPTSGKILWEGSRIHERDSHEISKTLSLVSQSPQMPFDFTVWDVVSMGRYPYKAVTKFQSKCPEIVQWALTVVDVWHLRDQKVNCLSAGEKQRVYIARTLSTESPVILLDEPTSCLDIRHQLQIWQLLRILVQQGKVIVVTIHDLNATERFCDQVAILNQGRCVANGKFADVIRPDLLRQVFGVIVDKPSLQTTSFNLPN